MNEFDELIRKKASELRAEAFANHVNWESRKTWWKKRLGELFCEIHQWFQPLIDEEIIQFKEEVIDLHEEQFGSYQASKLTLSIGLSNFEVVPVGSVIVGGFGRVDLIGPHGRAMLILAAENATLPLEERQLSSKWYLVNRDNRLKLAPLSEETFKQIFSDLI